MKTLLLLTVSFVFCFRLSAEDPAFLDKELEERITLNAEYKIDFTESAKESELAHELVPLETQNGQDWVEFLTYVKNSDDEKLKIYVLKIELQAELIGYLYDLEYAESFAEKTEIFQEVEKYKKKLAALKAFETPMGEKTPEVPE